MSNHRRELEQLLAELTRHRGWRVAPTRNGHYKITGPRGVLYHASSTPSDHRSVRNARAYLRRHGAPIR